MFSMEDDKEAESFSETLFTYLWFSQGYISENSTVDIFADDSVFVATVSEVVNRLSALSSPEIDNKIESFFTKHVMTRRNVFSFLASCCFEHHLINTDIFSVILYTFVCVFQTLLYCHEKSEDKFIDFASMCWTEVFKHDLSVEFYANGGWEEFERYVNTYHIVTTRRKMLKEKERLKDMPDFIPRQNIDDSVNTEETNEHDCCVHSSKLIGEVPMDESIYHNSLNFINACIHESNITPEEAINTYELLTSFYGQNCDKDNCDQSCDETSEPDDIDMEHIYKTLSSFISQGLLEVETKTGRIVLPNIIHGEANHNGSLCCVSCHQTEIISNRREKSFSKKCPSIVSELNKDNNNRLESES